MRASVSCLVSTVAALLVLTALVNTATASPSMRMYQPSESTRQKYLRDRMLANLQRIEASLLRQGLRRLPSQPSRYETAEIDPESVESNEEPYLNRPGSGQGPRDVTDMEGIRRMRRNFRKRNYNLDHLARMNFRRSFRASAFNDRHILGGL